jgi:hypothetical protein
MSTTTTLMQMRTESPGTRRSTEAWSALSCTWRQWGRTFSSLCACVLIFRHHHGLHIGRTLSGCSGIFDILLSLVFGTRRPVLFRFLFFRMQTSGMCQFLGSSLVSWSSRK